MSKDVLKDFEENYLPDWCHRNHLPRPKKAFTEHWQMAWTDYIKEVLTPDWEQMRTDYLCMPYKIENPIDENTSNPIYPTMNEVIDVLPSTEEKSKSDWEIVQEMLKNKRKC